MSLNPAGRQYMVGTHECGLSHKHYRRRSVLLTCRRRIKAYFAKFDEKGYGLQDIFGIEIFSDANPRKFFVRGIVSIKDLTSKFRDSVKVSALSKKDPNSMVIVYSNPKTGEYQLELAHGEYQIAYETEGTRKLPFRPQTTLGIPVRYICCLTKRP